MKGKMSIYYDEEGDYLEISIEGSSPTYGEDIGEDITLFKKKIIMKLLELEFLILKQEPKLLIV